MCCDLTAPDLKGLHPNGKRKMKLDRNHPVRMRVKYRGATCSMDQTSARGAVSLVALSRDMDKFFHTTECISLAMKRFEQNLARSANELPSNSLLTTVAANAKSPEQCSGLF
jgi:hypothetical protein